MRNMYKTQKETETQLLKSITIYSDLQPPVVKRPHHFDAVDFPPTIDVHTHTAVEGIRNGRLQGLQRLREILLDAALRPHLSLLRRLQHVVAVDDRFEGVHVVLEEPSPLEAQVELHTTDVVVQCKGSAAAV